MRLSDNYANKVNYAKSEDSFEKHIPKSKDHKDENLGKARSGAHREDRQSKEEKEIPHQNESNNSHHQRVLIREPRRTSENPSPKATESGNALYKGDTMIILEALKLIIKSTIIVLCKLFACESVFICAVIALCILCCGAYINTFRGEAE